MKGGDCSGGSSAANPIARLCFNKTEGVQIMDLPIKPQFTPYPHQVQAFEFACRLFSVSEGGDIPPVSKGVAYLMEMG